MADLIESWLKAIPSDGTGTPLMASTRRFHAADFIRQAHLIEILDWCLPLRSVLRRFAVYDVTNR